MTTFVDQVREMGLIQPHLSYLVNKGSHLSSSRCKAAVQELFPPSSFRSGLQASGASGEDGNLAGAVQERPGIDLDSGRSRR